MRLIPLVILVLAFGCSTGTRRSGASDNVSQQDLALERAKQENTPDAKEYENLDNLYRRHEFDLVIKKAKAFTTHYPASSFADQVQNLRALSYLGLKQFQTAAQSFRKTIEIARSESLKDMCYYNLAYAYFEMGQADSASKALDGVHLGSLDRSERVKYHVLRAKVDRQRHNSISSAREILSAIDNLGDPKPKASLEAMLGFLNEALDQINDSAELEKLLSDFSDVPGADHLLYRLGVASYSSSNRSAAKNYFSRLVGKFPESRYFASANDFLRKSDAQGPADFTRIGVLLTLSGKAGKTGYKALQGIELALKIFQPFKPGNGQRNGAISIIVIDDQGDPDRAAAALEELYYTYHVIAVIGPIVSKLAESAGKKAQELGIPLIAMTQKEATGGDYVFNAALTPEMQVRELKSYAERIGASRFAVLAPKSKFGETYVSAFLNEIERTSGTLRGFETYADDETDFRAYVDKLVGLGQTDARAKEVEELRLLKAATPIKGRSKKFDRMFDLKPIVDFDAVFIPDEPRALGQILPTFAYRDVDKMLFLGINTWNSQELIARAGNFAEGAVFVDGFFAGSEKPSTREFIEEYRATFGTEPTLVEALAYDAAHILVSDLQHHELKTRAELRDRITQLRDFQGVTGKISYSDGRLVKRLSLLTVKNGRIEEIAF